MAIGAGASVVPGRLQPLLGVAILELLGVTVLVVLGTGRLEPSRTMMRMPKAEATVGCTGPCPCADAGAGTMARTPRVAASRSCLRMDRLPASVRKHASSLHRAV